MKLNYRQRQKCGFTLLLTLMALILLAGLIVQFQSDAAVHVRTSTFRLDQIQCRYAAESALVVACQLIKDALSENAKAQPASSPSTPPQPPEEPNSPDELIDDVIEDEYLGKKPTGLFINKTIQIGRAGAEIEIHDENGKFPLYWLLHSPYLKKRSYVEEALRKLGSELQGKSSDVAKAVNLTLDMGNDLKVPEPERYLYTRRSRNRKTTGRVFWRSRSYRRTREQRKPKAFLEREKKRYQSMAAFARRWRREMSENEPLHAGPSERGESLSDFLGCWGHSTININTAGPEVIHAAFEALGVTKTIAQAIVDYRQKTPFTSTRNLRKIPNIKLDNLEAIRSLSRVSSDTFYVCVTARLGRAHYSLIGGIYKNRKNNLVNYAVFPGD